MYLKYFYDKHLAQASYMVGCQATGEAAIIDPSRNIEPYLQIAGEEGFSITKALETHIHADFVSGVTELARRTGATIYHSVEGEPNGGYNFDSNLPQQGLKDSDVISVGKVQLKTVHTPGHTPEHISFELTDTAKSDNPMGIFTGDFVFVGDVGRPDLLEKSAGIKDSAKKGAREMFHSLKQFKKYDGYMQIWPGHGAGSSCGKSLGAVPASTVGYEIMNNPAFRPSAEQEFVDFLLDEQREPPKYFGTMKKVNTSGMTPLSEVPAAVRMDMDGNSIAELANSEKNIVIDTRSARNFSNANLTGTVNLPFPGPFAEWMGRLADYESNLYIVMDPVHADEIQKICSAMGMDNYKGYFPAAIVEKTETTRAYTNEYPKKVEEKRQKEELQIVDVRYEDEWEKGHIPDARHIPLQRLHEEAKNLSKKKPVAVHCASGTRSAIASSILLNQGFEVINILGGFTEWEKEQLPTTKE